MPPLRIGWKVVSFELGTGRNEGCPGHPESHMIFIYKYSTTTQRLPLYAQKLVTLAPEPAYTFKLEPEKRRKRTKVVGTCISHEHPALVAQLVERGTSKRYTLYSTVMPRSTVQIRTGASSRYPSSSLGIPFAVGGVVEAVERLSCREPHPPGPTFARREDGSKQR